MILLWLIMVALVASAQDPAEPSLSSPGEALSAGRSLTARRLAQERLETEPDDIESHIVIAQVTWEEDGRHAQALARYRHAEQLFHRDRDQLGPEAWRIEARILRSVYYLASEMGRYDLALEYAQTYNKRYQPMIEAETAWGLMAMGRLDEARRVAEAGAQGSDYNQRMTAMNTLCALDARQPDRLRALETCEAYLAAAGGARATEITSMRNTALAALGALRYDRAEELLQSAGRTTPGGWTNPFMDLTAIYLDQGRGAEAAQAALRAQQWRVAQSGSDRAQTRAKDDAILATLLLIAGEPERARMLIDRSLSLPDRSAASTATDDSTRGGHALLRIQIRRAQEQRRAEAAAERGWLPATQAFVQGLLPDGSDWVDHATVRAALLDGSLLRGSLYDNDEIKLVMLRTWMIGELAPIVGPGVMRAALAQSALYANPPELVSIIRAHETELDCRWPSKAAAQALLQEIERIPRQEALLRARMAALAADCGWRAGDRSTALGAYETALEIDPGVLRRLALRLPVSIQHDGSEVARTAAFRLRSSPRFRVTSPGFVVSLTADRACLSSPTGSQIGCWSASGPEPSDEAPTSDQRAASLLRALHDGAFAMPIGLTGHDLRSLDGTTVLDRERHRARMDQLLEAL